MITIPLLTLAGYFGWLAGRRWERGRIELAEAQHQEEMSAPRRRGGGVRLSTMQIKR